MNRKTIFISLGSVVGLALIVGVIFLFSQLERKETSEAINAIPTDAAIVVKLSNLSSLSEDLANNPFWGAMGNFRLVSEVNKFFDFANKQKASSPTFNELVMNSEVFMSVHVVGNGVPEALFVTNVPERIKPSDVHKYIVDVANKNYIINSKEYNGSKIFTLNHKQNESANSYTFAIRQGVVIFSRSLLLVESSVGQLSSGISLTQDKSFVVAYNTAGTRININVLINHAKLPTAFGSQIHASRQAGFSWISKTGKWTELDLGIKQNAFFLNGFAQAPDSLNIFYKIFAKQKPVKNGVVSILPAQTAAFVHLGISNLKSYFKSYRNFLSSHGKLNRYNHRLNDFNKQLGSNAEDLYLSFFGKQVALAFIPFEGEIWESS